MIFENRLAKIGKGFNVNLYVKNSNEILIHLYNNYCSEKCLNIENEKYQLKLNDMVFSSEEIIKLSENFYVYKQNNRIGIINQNV